MTAACLSTLDVLLEEEMSEKRSISTALQLAGDIAIAPVAKDSATSFKKTAPAFVKDEQPQLVPVGEFYLLNKFLHASQIY